jgi:hypothetical protein
MTTKPLIERAYELAAESECRDWNGIAWKLKSEGYMMVDSHFAGPQIKKEINAICARRRGQR